MANKKAKNRAKGRGRTMRLGMLALLCVLGVALLAGMALFNGGVKPNRDMQWYVREGAVEVAAPALGEGYAEAEEADGEFLLPEEGIRQLPTEEPTPEPTPELTPEPVADAPEDGFAPEDIGAEDFAPEEITSEDIGAEDLDAQQIDAGEPEEYADPAELEEDLMVDPEEAEPEAIEPMGEVTIKITAAGDCTFEGEVNSKSNVRFLQYEQEYGMDYFMDGVRDIFQDDDLTIVNLEGPLTTETKKHAHGFVFKADPRCVDILTGSSVELCNVANNHSRDYGTNGLKETAEVLDAAGVGYCGYTVAYETTIKGVRVCSLGFTKWDQSNEQIVQAVQAMRPSCDLLIVNMHWGQEHVHDQNAQQVATGHAIIDAGADLVIGTHPHVIQGIELYKGKYIVYSLGNFCFAGNSNPDDKRCIIFQQTFSFTPGMGIVQAGILNEGINIIPCTVSSVNNYNDFQPTVLGAEQGAQVLRFLSGYCNFKFKEVRWMPDNYLAQNGLIQTGADDAAQSGDGGEASDEAIGQAGEASDAAAPTYQLPVDIDDEVEPFFSRAGGAA